MNLNLAEIIPISFGGLYFIIICRTERLITLVFYIFLLYYSNFLVNYLKDNDYFN